MKAKKFLSALFAGLFMCSFLNINVLAADAETEPIEVTEAVAEIGDKKYTSLQAALDAAGSGEVEIGLLKDVTIDYGAREAYCTAETTSVTINGNSKTLTLNQTDSDWSSFGLANADAKLILNNVTIEKTGYGDTSGAWNTHAINFTCNVEMDGVTVNNSVSVQNGTTLNDVTINEANGYYGLWIKGNGQTVTVTGGAISATNGGRGIKIADQYISGPESVTLEVTGTKFKTAEKAAVLVSSTAGAAITASNVDITEVVADSTNFVWVDEDWKDFFNKVTVTGCTKYQEGATTDADYIKWIKEQLLAGNDVTLERDIVVDGSYITSEAHTVNSNGKYPNYGIFTVLGDHDVTIDLNGYNVTYNGHADFEWNDKTVNSCKVAHGLFFANGGADLTIKDSKGKSVITVYGLASGAYVATPDTTLTIEGGTWKNNGCINCGGTNIFLYPLQGGELYIKGGHFEQALDADGESYLIVEHGGAYANSVIDYSKTKVEISGGTFVGMNPAKIKKFNQTADNKLDMTTDPTTNGCADGYESKDNGDGTYGVLYNPVTCDWTTETDAGYYMNGTDKLGLMRWLFMVTPNGDIDTVGIEYQGTNTTTSVEKGVDTTITGDGAIVFYGDVNGFKETEAIKDTYSARGFVKSGSTTNYSDTVENAPDWDRALDYKGGNE